MKPKEEKMVKLDITVSPKNRAFLDEQVDAEVMPNRSALVNSYITEKRKARSKKN